MHPRGFASDNYAGVHPEVLAAIAAANADHAPAYGADPWTERAHALIRDTLGLPDADPYLVFNGTGANVVCLSSLCRSWEAVICADTAHLNVDEAAAPEITGRVKLLTVPTPDGKLTPELCAARFVRRGDEHVVAGRASSPSRSRPSSAPSTRGTRSARWPTSRTRTTCCCTSTARGSSTAALDTLDGVDAVSLGLTKIGALGAEAAVLRPARRRTPSGCASSSCS